MNDKNLKDRICYKHTCLITNKSYIGVSVSSMERRLQIHVSDTNNGSPLHFHRALRKYGVEHFVSEILEDKISHEDYNVREKYWVEQYDTFNKGYNMTEGGESSFPILSGKDNGFYGKTHSKESIDKMRIGKIGKKATEATKKLLSEKRSQDKNPMAKEYIFTSPSNKVYKVNGGSKNFCEEHGINLSIFNRYDNNEVIDFKVTKRSSVSTINTIGWKRKEIVND